MHITPKATAKKGKLMQHSYYDKINDQSLFVLYQK